MKTLSRFLNELAKTVSVKGQTNTQPKGMTQTIGWFNNKYNASGWTIHPLDGADKGFLESQGVKGDDIFRVVSDNNNTSLVKLNVKKGTYAFANNSRLEETDELVFDRMVRFKEMRIDDTPLARKTFGV